MTHTLFSAPPPATGSTGQTAEQQKLFLILLFVSFMAGKASKIFIKSKSHLFARRQYGVGVSMSASYHLGLGSSLGSKKLFSFIFCI